MTAAHSSGRQPPVSSSSSSRTHPCPCHASYSSSRPPTTRTQNIIVRPPTHPPTHVCTARQRVQYRSHLFTSLMLPNNESPHISTRLDFFYDSLRVVHSPPAPEHCIYHAYFHVFALRPEKKHKKPRFVFSPFGAIPFFSLFIFVSNRSIMLSTVLAVLSLQLNGWFQYADVSHRLPVVAPRATYLYGNIDAYIGTFVPTSIPEHVVVVFEGDRVHGFLHDSENIRHCLWDGELEIRQKVKIAATMMEWLHPEKPISHSVYKYEDVVVLTAAKAYLNMTEDNTTV